MNFETRCNPAVHDVTVDTPINKIINAEEFDGFGKFIFPRERIFNLDMPLSDVATLLPCHHNVDADESRDCINYMMHEVHSGRQIFYQFYDAEEEANKDTGLFFFRGRPGAHFAIICAGGGFAYVGSIHEGFPIAIELARKGINAFVIQYRAGRKAKYACEDLAKAITFLFNHANSLAIHPEDYSLWGCSAGACMAAQVGSTISSYGDEDLPQPAATVLAYVPYTMVTQKDPPAYSIIGSEDSIIGQKAMRTRTDRLVKYGIPAEFHVVEGMPHGFGLGRGTPADGWVDDALAFWKKQCAN